LLLLKLKLKLFMVVVVAAAAALFGWYHLICWDHVTKET
jgi:hypothetical protein